MEHILNLITEHQNNLMQQLKDAVAQIKDPQEQAEFNRWNAKIQAVHKLPVEERQNALNEIINEFKHYQS